MQELDGRRAVLVEAHTARFLKECTFSPATNEGEKRRLLERLMDGSQPSKGSTPAEGSEQAADDVSDLRGDPDPDGPCHGQGL